MKHSGSWRFSHEIVSLCKDRTYCLSTSILLLCLVGFAFSQEANPTERKPMPTKVFSVRHHGKVLHVKPGECFSLILANPGSGGYTVRDPEFDSSVLVLQEMKKRPPSDAAGGGDFGVFEWTFLPIKEGRSRLIVRAFRPWEKDKTHMILFSATVDVVQSTNKYGGLP